MVTRGHILIVLFLFVGCIATAQQLPQFSQYMINDYVINPAIAGTKPYFEAKLNQRHQWAGIDDAPRTYTLSVNGPLKSRKVGIGGYLFTDVTGPTKRSGFYGSYSYILTLSDEAKLSLSLSMGLLQYSVDGSKIQLENPNDVAISGALQSAVLPDAGFGFHLYSEKFYLGASAPQLFESNIKFFEEAKNGQSGLSRHFFLMGGYKIKTAGLFSFDPSFLVKYVEPTPVQFEISARATYNNAVWIGGSFRTNDAIAILVGYNYLENISFGYAYDIITSGLNNYSSGSHEIMLGIRFMRSLPKK
jgi:type IX secretion system PorP/SprF family membrane protein